jgi:hypothetical protein
VDRKYRYRRAGDWRVRVERSRGRRRRTNPAGAEFDHDELHDGLQRAGGELSNQLRAAQHVVKFGDDYRQ